ncbi:MAG: hypothetical protein RR853_09235, partial [Aurantimicrobium sp.]|uniref:hypothetical protein n=1 Tax=Aurantimicrobium sp. TaxID=1930784 RepID=UPI002FCA86D6
MEIRAEKLTVAPERIFLRDQLDEQDKLIEILKDHIGSLEEVISPLLREELSEAGSDETADASPSTMAPLQ